MSRFLLLVSLSVQVGIEIVVLSPPVASSGAPQSSPSALLASAFRDADNAGWVHEVVTVNDSGAITMKVVDDIGTAEGRQVTTFANGGTDTLVAFDSKHQLFERANGKGLKDYAITTSIGFYANKWMMATPSNPDYAYNAVGTTLRSDFAQYTPKDVLSVGPAITMDGREVRAIKGFEPATATLAAAAVTIYVTASENVLPVLMVETSKSPTVIVHESWSDWGHAVALTSPSIFVPFPTSNTAPTSA